MNDSWEVYIYEHRVVSRHGPLVHNREELEALSYVWGSIIAEGRLGFTLRTIDD